MMEKVVVEDVGCYHSMKTNRRSLRAASAKKNDLEQWKVKEVFDPESVSNDSCESKYFSW
jgi:hypothetical protein